MSVAQKEEAQAHDPNFREKLESVGKDLEQQQEKPTTTLPIKDQKALLANLVGTFIIKEPKFSGGTDSTADLVRETVKAVAEEDPEFVLKLAYYVRSKLYLRSTANCLLMFALRTPKCQPFVRKWFNGCVNLPSDLLEVVELLRADNDGKLSTNIRKLFNNKFQEFSVYQFGKYNNANKLKRKRKKEAKAAKPKPTEGEEKKEEPEKKAEPEKQEEPEKKKAKLEPLTIKQLIRVCHTAEPAEVIMSICGCRYPENEEAFKKAGLTGDYNKEKAGQRMKLPVPVTWETEISSKGNKASTWEGLIDGKNLPFMAMMRNLRNLCEAGIDDKHHKAILARLRDEAQVTGSKQLPFRFLSAFEAVTFDEETLKALKAATETGQEFTEKVYKFKTAEGKKGKITKKKPTPKHAPTAELLAEYRSALEDAIRISVVNNLPPLRGSTAVFTDISGSMDTSLTPPRFKEAPSNLHKDSTGKQLKAGEDFDLDDYFSSVGKECSNVLELSMIWKQKKQQGSVDLDLSCMMLNKEGKEVGHVNYCSRTATGIQHSGDIRSAPDGAEEVIRIELDKQPEEIVAIYCTVNSYSHQTFDSLEYAAFALRDASNVKQEIAAFPLNGKQRGIVSAALVRKPGTKRAVKKAGEEHKFVSSWAFRVVNDSHEGHSATVSSLKGLITKNYNDFADSWKFPGRTLMDMGLLFGLCAKYMSEECTLFGFGSTCECLDSVIEDDKILPNIKKLKDHILANIKRGTVPPVEAVKKLEADKKYLDTIILLTDTILPDADKLRAALDSYRQNVNPAVLIVTIDLLGTGQVVTAGPEKPMDLQFSGFSDQLLRYIAGYNQDPLEEIENIEPPAPKGPQKKKK
eukprot:TRINITY_DN48987_c0_g1_i1.p1 TRINITY_DN48987_c0_g1~~TRINITY_DN48987_c0_g1_i1.p1  ORF type:complete len:857 (-),score=123.12 TRINITY_DN48987_c0_g1_i1:1601-4171(-)